MFFRQRDIKTKQKKNGRDAGHRSPDWGCTKTPIFNENIWWWPINHRTRLVLKLTSLRKRRKLFSFPWRTPKSQVHLFATKWVHIKHYGLKIGGPNFWRDSASFLISKNQDFTKSGSRFPGTCLFWKKSRRQAKTATTRTGEQNLFLPESPNPWIPDPESPNLKISQIPKMQIWKFAILDDKTMNIFRWSFFGKFRNWQIQHFQINSPLSTDRFWINWPLPYPRIP